MVPPELIIPILIALVVVVITAVVIGVLLIAVFYLAGIDGFGSRPSPPLPTQLDKSGEDSND